jgi:elongation factor Ts
MSTKVTNEQIKILRGITGAGMMSCKDALVENDGNIEKAIEYLRKKGLASAEKKQARTAKEGIITSYIHTGSKLGVLVELNCETDFVARRSEFQQLAQDIAMQIAANPMVEYVSIEDIPEEIKNKEKSIELEKDDIKDKPLPIKEKIVEGRIQKTLSSAVLLDQPFIKDPSIKIDELLKRNISLVGENIKVSRFVRFILGEVNITK